MAAPMTYLVTGANKGIGKRMVASLLLRPGTIVVATVRNPDTEEAKSLLVLPVGENSRLVVIKLDGASASDGFDALKDHLEGNNITHLDVVIANAGNSSSFNTALGTTAADLLYDFEVNTVGLLRLFQVTWPFLEKSDDAGDPHRKKFVFISSSVGSIGLIDHEGFVGAAYGTSKAAANYLTKGIAFEFKAKGLKVAVIHPGWVKTTMGQRFADAVGAAEAAMTVEDSARGVLEQVDKLSFDTTSGHFLSHDGQELPW